MNSTILQILTGYGQGLWLESNYDMLDEKSSETMRESVRQEAELLFCNMLV